MASWSKPLRRNIVIKECLATMRRIGLAIVQDKKQVLAAVHGDEKNRTVEKDLLTALIRSNMQETGARRMDDEEVLAQIATFIIAGESAQPAS